MAYHGLDFGSRGRLILIVAPGLHARVLRHITRHSPAGLNWGYTGSGPADTAFSILVDACGPAAVCPACRGTGRVAFEARAPGRPPLPWDPCRPPGEYAAAGLQIAGCGNWDCDGGYRKLPYLAFESACVARWEKEFRITRSHVLAWLHAYEAGLPAAGAQGYTRDPAAEPPTGRNDGR